MIVLGGLQVYPMDSIVCRMDDRIVIEIEMESRFLIVVALVFTEKLKS